MLDKYVYINPNEFRISVKQVSGQIQINDLTVSGKCRKQMVNRLKLTIDDVFDVLDPINKQLAKINCEQEKKVVKKKTKKETDSLVKGLK